MLNRLTVLEIVDDNAGHGKVLEIMSKYQPKRAEVTVN
jgi:hypothetical protein